MGVAGRGEREELLAPTDELTVIILNMLCASYEVTELADYPSIAMGDTESQKIGTLQTSVVRPIPTATATAT